MIDAARREIEAGAGAATLRRGIAGLDHVHPWRRRDRIGGRHGVGPADSRSGRNSGRHLRQLLPAARTAPCVCLPSRRRRRSVPLRTGRRALDLRGRSFHPVSAEWNAPAHHAPPQGHVFFPDRQLHVPYPIQNHAELLGRRISPGGRRQETSGPLRRGRYLPRLARDFVWGEPVSGILLSLSRALYRRPLSSHRAPGCAEVAQRRRGLQCGVRLPGRWSRCADRRDGRPMPYSATPAR